MPNALYAVSHLLQTGNFSTVPAYPSFAIDAGKMLAIVKDCRVRGTKYGLGAKSHDLNSSPLDAPAIDCSGFLRYLLFKATGGTLLIPDGSTNQNDWAASQGLKHYGKANYGNCENHDGFLRLCFCRASASEPIGHVWLCYNGMTLESHASIGPSSRAWDTPVLSRIVTDCYVLCHIAA